MPSQERRKVLRIGSRTKSSAVTLPKPWCDYAALRGGEQLDILYDGILVILPPNTRPEVKARVRELLEGSGDARHAEAPP